MKCVCTACKQELDLQLYFYDVEIIKDTSYLELDPEYYACAKIKGICPCCGYLIRDSLKSVISCNDIVQFIKEKNYDEVKDI
jgi:hypothetical protein